MAGAQITMLILVDKGVPSILCWNSDAYFGVKIHELINFRIIIKILVNHFLIILSPNFGDSSQILIIFGHKNWWIQNWGNVDRYR